MARTATSSKAPTAPSNKRITLSKNNLIWKSPADVKKALGDKVTINGTRINLNGYVLYGGKLPRKNNDQDENALGIEIRFANAAFSNGWVDDIPGGMSAREKNAMFAGMKFVNIGEDAISTVGERATGITIQKCDFWNAGGDKSIQLNQADDAVIDECNIDGGITGIRLQKDSYKTASPAAALANIRFSNVETAINAAGKIRATVKGMKYSNVRKQGVTSNGAKIVKV